MTKVDLYRFKTAKDLLAETGLGVKELIALVDAEIETLLKEK